MITIIYFLSKENKTSDVELGRTSFDGIDQVMTPFFTFPIGDTKRYPLFITKFFNKKIQHRWEIKNTEIESSEKDDLLIHMWLSPIDVSNDIYLSQTLKRKGLRSAASLLHKGKIVIVEFGHINKCIKKSAEVSSNKRYPDNIQHGEMHKRRPAIVVKVDERGVKVIPLTSKKPSNLDDNNLTFELSEDSKKDIGDFIKKETYALCNMIQTVCVTRILPPLFRVKNRNTFFRHDEYRAKLSKKDMKLLDKGLLSSISKPNIYSELKKTKEDNIKLNDKLNDTIKKLQLLKEMYMYTNDSNANNIDDVDIEIKKYQERQEK
ncbi:hypothetical protein E2566_08090 [Pectobacterium punjabense]|uniref:Uncharacterized protein n=1 Tax=Pectobacterium punjabense TaxID=2108399 RepID=A0ABX6L0L7_9GAMM|nr:type II toxin-antitoxin system PemK/MazF family toxin [Pectobacterium punjabense]MBS4433273.1 type II toxin-antitoxin system PemK/MazF family toxin [Pectobacterium punjabense]PTA64114.1 hypothetical protein C9I36_11405 [Pectobacterium punjabense]QJA19880.1 hypothetical protein E2566_08090 [Pectobacterium punjabense]